MNTFLPYPDYVQSAECLDTKRLGKQRVEVLQILRTLLGLSDGWKNHPAVKMWGGCEPSLVLYGIAVCDEWVRRGYLDTCKSKILDICDPLGGEYCIPIPTPRWFGDPDFHASHRSNLLRKDHDWYGRFGWTEPDNLPYVWPV